MLSCVVMLCGQLSAQNRTITGKVLDPEGKPVPGASIVIRGFQTGTSSGADGTFSLPVPPKAKILIISAIGWANQEVEIGDRTSITVAMSAKDNTLSEVVVTSLGIVRDKRSLGYATQNLKGDQLADKGPVNLVGSLEGKVSGVNITGASGSPGSSININIRGITSFTGSNQPLFVVDGIPISNDVDRTTGGPNGTLDDQQPPNRALDLDLNNIESVNILKGPAAAVLYGSRAAAGAIIITTKKGGGPGGKTDISVSSSYSLQNVEGLLKVQNQYGQGLNGVYTPTTTLSSWGPKFGSTPTVANGLLVGGNPVAYQAYPNNITDFFETGNISDNNLTINGGDLKRNYTLSIGYLNQNGIIPNTSLKRTNVKFGANTLLRDKIKLGANMNFVNTLQTGVIGGNGNSVFGVLWGMARNVDLHSYKTKGNYQNPDGTNNWPVAAQDNPYFDAYNNPVKSNLYRIIADMTVGYDFTSWLNLTYRLGVDAYTDRRKQVFAITSNQRPTGQDLENTIFRSEINGDLILSAHKSDVFIKDLNISGILGQNINQRNVQSLQVQGDALAIPGFYNVSNATVYSNGSGEATTLQRLVGYYAQVSFDYKSYLYLELTGRADQSSTLPTSKNTYFYPSISAGFVFTDALNIVGDGLSYGKVRASIAKVGRDAPAYQLQNLFVSEAFGNNVASFNFPDGSIAGFGASNRIASNTLSPEFTTSYEVGINLGFWKNRINFDADYFDEVSQSQIVNVGIAPSTGYTTQTTNVGKMTNKGVEALINITAVSGRNFRWDLSGNFTKIVNKVESINTGTLSFSIPGSAFTGSIPSIKVGQPYGVILGGTIPRDSATGRRLINPATGTYQPTLANQVLSNPNPDYSFGVTNNFKYKNLSLGFTFDFTKGGQVLSFTAASYKSRGAWIGTGDDRSLPRVLDGVIAIGGGKVVENNIQIPAQTYWQTLGGLQSEFNVYDATVFRLREVSIGYDLPSRIIKDMHINGVRFSLFANN
ncbi:MAG: SusC/RagA family TonB-linked outer membrane protein, partial [Bacteroidota bacterium]|nr:SusC/RagA family TonB-linked outer membrane protein [Bacteroidota bacterium]